MHLFKSLSNNKVFMLPNSESSNETSLKKLSFWKFSVISPMDFMAFIRIIFLYRHNNERVEKGWF